MSVCNNQDTFNASVNDAINYSIKQNEPSNTVQYVLVAVYLLAIIWAIMLAFRSNRGPEMQKNLVLAIVFAPVYIVSYYVTK